MTLAQKVAFAGADAVEWQYGFIISSSTGSSTRSSRSSSEQTFRWSERQLLITAGILIFVVPIAGAWAFARLGWEPQQYLFAISISIAESLGAGTSPDKALERLRRDDVAGWASWQLSGTP